MKTYMITAKQTLVEMWTYTVEAESEEEALKMVTEGDIDDNADHQSWDLGDLNYGIDVIEEYEKTPPCIRHDMASWEEEDKLNKRIDIIGQNGNEGTHYDNQNK